MRRIKEIISEEFHAKAKIPAMQILTKVVQLMPKGVVNALDIPATTDGKVDDRRANVLLNKIYKMVLDMQTYHRLRRPSNVAAHQPLAEEMQKENSLLCF